MGIWTCVDTPDPCSHHILIVALQVEENHQGTSDYAQSVSCQAPWGQPAQDCRGLPGCCGDQGFAGPVSRTGQGDSSLRAVCATKPTKPALVMRHQRKMWVPGADLAALQCDARGLGSSFQDVCWVYVVGTFALCVWAAGTVTCGEACLLEVSVSASAVAVSLKHQASTAPVSSRGEPKRSVPSALLLPRDLSPGADWSRFHMPPFYGLI